MNQKSTSPKWAPSYPLVTALRGVGVECDPPRATMYQWVRLPEGLLSETLAHDLLEEEGLAVLAGSVFGASGEGFIRMSFVVAPERLREAAQRFGRIMDRIGAAGKKGRA